MTKLEDRPPSRYMVTLSDGKVYCFYPFTTRDELRLRFKVRAVENIQDEDLKTAMTQDKEAIPENTELEVADVIDNCYGRWLEVIYNNSHYYIDPSKVEYIYETDRYRIYSSSREVKRK